MNRKIEPVHIRVTGPRESVVRAMQVIQAALDAEGFPEVRPEPSLRLVRGGAA